MECPFTECVYNDKCGFLDITKKIPKSKDKCSWYTTNVKEKTKLGVNNDGDNAGSKAVKRRNPSKKKQPNR